MCIRDRTRTSSCRGSGRISERISPRLDPVIQNERASLRVFSILFTSRVVLHYRSARARQAGKPKGPPVSDLSNSPVDGGSMTSREIVIQDGYRSQQNSRSLLLSVGLLFSLTIAVALIVQASPRLERALSFKGDCCFRHQGGSHRFVGQELPRFPKRSLLTP